MFKIHGKENLLWVYEKILEGCFEVEQFLKFWIVSKEENFPPETFTRNFSLNHTVKETKPKHIRCNEVGDYDRMISISSWTNFQNHMFEFFKFYAIKDNFCYGS